MNIAERKMYIIRALRAVERNEEPGVEYWVPDHGEGGGMLLFGDVCEVWAGGAVQVITARGAVGEGLRM